MESIKCPGCNATLMYDLEDKELKCNFCGTLCKIEEEKNTDAEFLEKRFMTIHETSCPECGARLMADLNTVSSRCTYCGSSLVYSEKIDKAFKPKKILLFEIGLEEAKEKVKKYFEKSAFEYKDCVLDVLEPIYLPYWMYDCMCEAEYDYYSGSKHKKHYLETALIECSGILADASTKIEDKLSDQLDKYFDLSKLRDFDISYITGFCAEEYDVTFKSVYSRLNKKLESEVIERELGFPIIATKKINVSQINSTYIQLPFYYAEVNGLKILVNGQSGDIAINSKEYLKTSRRIAFENFLYGETVQNNSTSIAFLGVIFIFFALGVCMFAWENLLSIFPALDYAPSVLILAGLIGGTLYCKFKKKKQRYIKKIIFRKQKELYIWDEIARAKDKNVDTNDKYSMITAWIGLIMGIWLLGAMIFVGKILVTHMLTKDTALNIGIILIFGGMIIYTAVKVLSLIIRCILRIKGKL